jgi:hypothetical protein
MPFRTGSNAAIYSAFHFSAKTKRMYQESKHLPDVQKACKSHMDSPVVSKERQ